jgi:predicted Zn-dependent protease
MSFPVACPSCGAPSGPAVGVCPFCKAAIAAGPKGVKEHPTLTAIRKEYSEGRLNRALSLATTLERDNAKVAAKPAFGLLHAQILLEAEAPEHRIRTVLNRALADDAAHAELCDYLEILDAKSELTGEWNDRGEQSLRKLLRRSPGNAHALFILGSHLLWTHNDRSCLTHLERCVRQRPVFLRAWGCLGVAYRRMGNKALATRAFQRCVALETEPKMKQFFKTQLAELART